jgi:peptidoglycan/LPS O-acetylase OafA/YrhL
LHEKIDVCRGLFAYLVVAAHAFELSCTLDPRWGESLPEAVRRFLFYGSGSGVYYVMGFFVLSGYCIQGSVRRMASDDGFPLKTYMIARLTRILPLYYLALLFAAVVESAMVSWSVRPTVWRNGLSGQVLLCQTLLIQNFTQTFGSFAPSWSITNEVAYYVLFGLIAAVCAPLRLRSSIVGMGLCVGVGFALQLVYRAGFHHHAVLGTGLLFGLGSLWFLGALTAENRSGFRDAPRLRAVARAWPLALALSIGMWCSQHVHQEFVFLCAGGSFTLKIVHFIGQDALERDRDPNAPRREPRRHAVFLGLTSYPTYLFHGPLLLAFGALLQESRIATPWWWVWPAASAFAIVGSAPLAFLVERPLMTWRAGFLKGLKAETAPRAARRPESPILGIQR